MSSAWFVNSSNFEDYDEDSSGKHFYDYELPEALALFFKEAADSETATLTWSM